MAITRVLLVIPPSPQKLGAPLLGLQYVAAALLKAGVEVKIIDAAARYFDNDFKWIVAEADSFDPHMVGFSLFTRWVSHAYSLAKLMEGRYPMLIAGGAHATACPDETLQQGFDVAVIGEGEETMTRLIDIMQGLTTLDTVPGIKYRAADGAILDGPPGSPISDLDRLSFPLSSQQLFNPRWYMDSGSEAIPGGIITSRGCPARCIFCANYVTGRKYRSRSAGSVVAELNASHRQDGSTFFQFWDDALTADSRRIGELCNAIRLDLEFPLSWSASTIVTMVQPDMLRDLKAAGLTAIIFGAESGDNEILRAVGKGINTDSVILALEWAKSAGLMTVCDFMLGFPQDTAESLERTLRFMERIAPLVDSFSAMGVVIPLPGTPLYNSFHEQFGFSDWWLKESYSRFTPPPAAEDTINFTRYYCGDAALDLDFFHYSLEVKQMIQACLEFKGKHNLMYMGIGAGQ